LESVCVENRIHTQWNETATATGRLSSSFPNLQSLPNRPLDYLAVTAKGLASKEDVEREEKEGKGTELIIPHFSINVRDSFVAKNGFTLISADYSQLELRVLASVSGDSNLIQVFTKQHGDIHAEVAAAVTHKPLREVTDDDRTKAKRIVYGILYGMGVGTLAAQLQVTVKEANAFIKAFFASYPMVKRFISVVVAQATEVGHITTLNHRRRFITDLKASDAKGRARGERQAINSVIQGSAADIMKAALLNVFNALQGTEANIVLQLHDELMLEVPEKEATHFESILITCMEEAGHLKVPLVANTYFSLLS
jgi:DNA polymerase-1